MPSGTAAQDRLPSPTQTAAASGDLPRLPETIRLDAPGMGRMLTVAILPPLRPPTDDPGCFPVLVMTDAQDLFRRDRPATFGHAPIDGGLADRLMRDAEYYRSWRLAGRLDAAIATGDLPPLLVAAVFTDDGARSVDLAPWPWPAALSPRGPALGAVIVDGLLPRLADDYPICAGPQDTVIAGASLGGTFALWLGLERPDRIGLVAALSPVATTGTFLYPLEALASRRDLPATSRVVVDLGQREPGFANPRVIDPILAQAGLPAGRRTVTISLDGRHTAESWGERIVPALRLLFADRRLERVARRP